MNINLMLAARAWDALGREARANWYVLSGLEIPRLPEAIDALLSDKFDQFDESDAVTLSIVLTAVAKLASALYQCGVLTVRSEPRNAAGEISKTEGAEDEGMDHIGAFGARNRVSKRCARGRPRKRGRVVGQPDNGH